MNERSKSIGIVCNDLDKLRERCLVSSAYVLNPDEAERSGHLPREAVIPTDLRAPTDAELSHIIATDETDIKLQLCRIPRAMGDLALAVCQDPDFQMNAYALRHDLGGGIRGTPLAIRTDKPGLRCASVNVEKTNRYTNEPSIVALHIDTWPTADVSYLIGNLGDGIRHHGIAPDITRDTVGGTDSIDRAEYVRRRVELGDAAIYWFRLDEPGYDDSGQPVIDAIINTPVAYALHDGSTLGSKESSTVFFYAIDEPPVDAYPSLLA